MVRVIEKKKNTPKKIALITAAAAALIFVIHNLLFAGHASRLNVDSARVTIGSVQAGAFQELSAIDVSVDPLKSFYIYIEGGRVDKIFVTMAAWCRKATRF